MTTPQAGEVAPVIQGTINPTAVADPQSVAVHRFSKTLTDLVRRSGVYHTEQQMQDAIDTIEEFAKRHLDPGVRRMLTRETDVAPVEDVTKRKPPAGAPAPAVANAPIDYNALAAAIVAHQQALSAPANEEVAS